MFISYYRFSIAIIFWFIPQRSSINIPIGILVEPEDVPQIQMVQDYFLRIPSWPQQHSITLKSQVSSHNNLTQTDRAVCHLLNEGVYAIITSAKRESYQMLASFSNEYSVPFVSLSLPKMPYNFHVLFGFSIEPSTTLAIIDILKEYQRNDVVYVYDNTQGAGVLQVMFLRGYRTSNVNLLGIFKASDAASVNQYFHKLEDAKSRRSFVVILDTDTTLANDIIVRHVHDGKVGKNYHFIISKPMDDKFWERGVLEFGSLTITGFLVSGQSRMFEEKWKSLAWSRRQKKGSNETVSFTFNKAAVIVAESLRKWLKTRRYVNDDESWSRNCLQRSSRRFDNGIQLAQQIREGVTSDSFPEKIQFTSKGERRNIPLPVVEISDLKLKKVGTWSESHRFDISGRYTEAITLSLQSVKKMYKITSIINPPFMMIQGELNGTQSPKYEGYCKDLLDALSKELNFDYEISLVEDGKYGYYNANTGLWTGMVGELVRKKADMAIADLHVSPDRQRVIDFADYHLTTSLSVLMRNPHLVATSLSPYFFLNIFSNGIWICIIASALITIALSHVLIVYSGEPDNIEAASGIWGRKFTFVGTVWFVLGSGLIQSTAVYPRPVSCRILGASWWCFNLVLVALYIASTTTQMFANGSQTLEERSPKLDILHSLILETVMKESIQNNWPTIGIVKNGMLHRYVKQSSLPFLKDYEHYLTQHPEAFVSSVSEGVARVRSSGGKFAYVTESLHASYFSRLKPCDTVSVHDITETFYNAIALPLGSPLRRSLNTALDKLQTRGVLSFLREKWFQDRSACKSNNLQQRKRYPGGSLFTHSVHFAALTIGLVVVGIVAVGQYFWRIHKKEERRQKMSFEEVSMGQSLPLPPPEMLRDSSEGEENGMIEGWSERKLVPTSFCLSPNRLQSD